MEGGGWLVVQIMMLIVRTYLSHLLGTYVTILCNWLILCDRRHDSSFEQSVFKQFVIGDIVCPSLSFL